MVFCERETASDSLDRWNPGKHSQRFPVIPRFASFSILRSNALALGDDREYEG